MPETSFVTRENTSLSSYRNLFVPIGFFLALLILFLIIIKFGIATALSQRNELSESKRKEAILVTKENVLSSLAREISTQMQSASLALPSENTALSVVPRIRIAAGENSVILTQVTVGRSTEDESGISKVAISVDVGGTREAIIAFVKSVLDQSPLVTIDNLAFGESLGASGGQVRFTAYWAKFPTELPKIDEPVVELTDEEKGAIRKIIGLSQSPTFTGTSPQAPTGRVNPFGL